MHPEMQLTTAVLAVALLLVTLELVRRNRLAEDYCILWFALGALMLVLAFCPQALSLLARITGVRYEPSAVFIGVLVLCFSLIMHFSVVVSKLNRQVTRLTQTVALLTVSEHGEAHDAHPHCGRGGPGA